MEGSSSPHQTIFNCFRFNYIMLDAYLFDGLIPWVKAMAKTIHFTHFSSIHVQAPIASIEVSWSKELQQISIKATYFEVLEVFLLQ